MFGLCSNNWRSRLFHKESTADLREVVIEIQQQIKQDYKKGLLKIAKFSSRCFILGLKLHCRIVKADCNCCRWLFGVSPYWAYVWQVFILLFHSFNFQCPSQFRQTYHIQYVIKLLAHYGGNYGAWQNHTHCCRANNGWHKVNFPNNYLWASLNRMFTLI